MLLIHAVASIVMSHSGQGLVCPVQGEEIEAKGASLEYASAKFYMCCGGCTGQFTKSPEKFVKKLTEEKKVAGLSIFDPVSHTKIDAKKAIKETSDFEGIRYQFNTEEDKKAFDLEPAKYAKSPEKFSLTCPGSKEKMAAPSEAHAYADIDGVRYYICCPDCLKEVKVNGEKMVTAIADSVKPMAVIATPKEAKSHE